MIINGVRDIVFEQHYEKLVNAMIHHNVQFNVVNVLSRIEMMILIEAEAVRANNGDDTPLLNLVKRIRETFAAPQQAEELQSREEETETQPESIQPAAEPEVTEDQKQETKVFSFPKPKR